MARVDGFLMRAVEAGASDAHLAVGAQPVIRRFGQLTRMPSREVTEDLTRSMLDEILTPEQREKFKQDSEIDFAYDIPGKARFRCNAFVHRRGIDICFRSIKPTPPTFADLGIPDIMKKVCENHQGLILVTGGAGAGKSTTLAAMVDLINANKPNHVLTVEDPIEVIHPIKMGAVNQRQLGKHTRAYANALRAALRENPDVIVVGELRDLETITLAISASETGHLVVGSMNTSSAHKTIDKVIDSYPPGQQPQIRAMLGDSLKAVFTQRLVPRADGTGVALAYELLIGSTQLANLIREGKTFQIPNLMTTTKSRGSRSMDESLLDLYQKKVITHEVALKNCTNARMFAAPPEEPKPAEAAPADAAAAARPGAPGAGLTMRQGSASPPTPKAGTPAAAATMRQGGAPPPGAKPGAPPAAAAQKPSGLSSFFRPNR